MSETTPEKLTNFINNKFVAPKSGAYIESFNPATGKLQHLIPNSNSSDVDDAVNAAKSAFPAWKKKTTQERSTLLYKLADLLEQNIKRFAEAESADQGKPVSLATNLDIPRAIYNFRFFAGSVLHHEEASTHMDGLAVNYTHRAPVGVAGLITPWNLPLYLLTWKIAPAIAVGNTAVCKPSELTSHTAFLLCELIAQVLPPGVVNMVFGNGPNAGSALVSHPDVPLISFTGGTKTGEVITKLAAPYFKKLSLELGGKNPNIIFADAKLDECVATTVQSSFANQGEICLCGSRIFVQRPIYDDFVAKFVAASKKLVVGNPREASTTTGALVSKEHMEKILYYINVSKEEGGKIALGGDQPTLPSPFDNGYFVNPTIITDLHPVHSRVQQEEIFGPVVSIAPFDTEDEVVDFANSVKYGLSASVWTENVRIANRVALALESGTVWVNCWMTRDLRIPFGGYKQSGIGREGGNHSIDFYTEQKTICTKFA